MPAGQLLSTVPPWRATSGAQLTLCPKTGQHEVCTPRYAHPVLGSLFLEHMRRGVNNNNNNVGTLVFQARARQFTYVETHVFVVNSHHSLMVIPIFFFIFISRRISRRFAAHLVPKLSLDALLPSVTGTCSERVFQYLYLNSSLTHPLT